MTDLVTWTRPRDSIAQLTLNSPSNLNALTWEMGEAFSRAVTAIKQQNDIRAVMITGSGRAFSSGGDLAFIKANCDRDPKENERLMVQFYQQFLCVTSLPMPVIALINGPAVGAGLCLALACDLRLAAAAAKMGVNFTRIGLTPGMGCSFFLPRVLGKSRAAELLMSGRLVAAEEAKAIGLVHEIYADARLLEAEALTYLSMLTTNAPLALAGTKRLLARDLAGLGHALAEEAREQAIVFASQDVREGIQAIAEKRAPRFIGA